MECALIILILYHNGLIDVGEINDKISSLTSPEGLDSPPKLNNNPLEITLAYI